MSLYAKPAQDDTMAEINVTPFTDVLLVLMIIFLILAALAIPPGFERGLPSRCTPTCIGHAPKHTSVEVAVTANGRIFVGPQQVGENALYGVLASVARRDIKTKVDLTGDGRAPYRLIIRTLDAAKAAGLNDITFVTR
jgi:biopolymer transport protein ExbD